MMVWREVYAGHDWGFMVSFFSVLGLVCFIGKGMGGLYHGKA